MKTVKNMNTLNAMAKRGLIKLDNQTGSLIRGLYSPKTFVCYYVDGGKSQFEFNGKKYGVKFFDGCFNPYVMELAPE